MSSDAKRTLAAVTVIVLLGTIFGCAESVQSTKEGQAAAPKREGAQTSPTKAEPAPTKAEAQANADALMAQWKRKNPDREDQWIQEEKARHKIQPPADNTDVLKGEQGKGNTYGNYTDKDVLMWERETEKLVVEGSQIFHSAELLGGTVGVSCDMCHPDAANTHPETYPKFQPRWAGWHSCAT